MARKPLSKRLRFSVFERDNFCCQYCGERTPKVVLEVDHMIPVSKGGKDELTNLITSCFDCNRGKADRKLGNVQKSKVNSEEMELRAQQLEAYYKHQKKIDKLKEKKLDELATLWGGLWENKYALSDSGRNTVRLFMNSLPCDEIQEAMYIARDKVWTDVEMAFKYFCGICHNKKKQRYG